MAAFLFTFARAAANLGADIQAEAPMDFDKPPSVGVLLLIGLGAVLLICLSCACTAPFVPFLMGGRFKG